MIKSKVYPSFPFYSKYILSALLFATVVTPNTLSNTITTIVLHVADLEVSGARRGHITALISNNSASN